MTEESPLVVGDPTRRVDGSWLASDGNWYPASAQPGGAAPVPPASPLADASMSAYPDYSAPYPTPGTMTAQQPATIYPHQYGASPTQNQSQGLAIAALVLGVGALLVSLVPLFGLLSVPFALGAVGCGIGGVMKANRGNPGKGLAIGGIVTGSLALVASVLWIVLFVGVSDDINTDPADGFCNQDRWLQDPDC